ncbi:MAG: rhodanese-like domain-containing protein [bacterium]|jgi:rhodanese-related sulfurtransferase
MFNSLFNRSDESKRAKIEKIYQSQRNRFPGIQEITPEELKEIESTENVTLVDTRTPAEQEVSMLPKAITVEQFQAHPEQFRGTKVVAYCTVGVRSGTFVKSLEQGGWDAYNLMGAILGWTHVDGGLTSTEGPTKNVHIHGPSMNLTAEGYKPVW